MRELKKWKMVVEIDPDQPDEEGGRVMPSAGMDLLDTMICMRMIAWDLGKSMADADNGVKELAETKLIQAVLGAFEKGAYGEVEEE